MINWNRNDIEYNGKLGASFSDLAKILNTFYLYTDKEEKSVGQWLSNTGYWESWVTQWFLQNIKPGFICIDIGANYGYYTRIMEKMSTSSGDVYAIEANINLCNGIKKSIRDYPIDNAAPVSVLNFAVSDTNGKVTLNIPPEYIGGSSIVWGKENLPSNIENNLWTESLEVDSYTLDFKLNNLNHIDIIKMDIEGAEYLAWRGMKKILDKTDIVVIELGSYSHNELKDDIYANYDVKYIDFDGLEKDLFRADLDKLDDLVMAVLRKK